MTYIGIDPGKKGAMAMIDGEKNIHLIPFDEREYVNALFRLDEKESVCCIEHVSAMPGNGAVSMFEFGRNFGWIQGVLSALGIPFELVRPKVWQKEFSVTGDKNTSISVCKRLFPNVDLRRTERCKKDHDGFSDALLIAEYCRRHMK